MDKNLHSILFILVGIAEISLVNIKTTIQLQINTSSLIMLSPFVDTQIVLLGIRNYDVLIRYLFYSEESF